MLLVPITTFSALEMGVAAKNPAFRTDWMGGIWRLLLEMRQMMKFTQYRNIDS